MGVVGVISLVLLVIVEFTKIIFRTKFNINFEIKLKHKLIISLLIVNLLFFIDLLVVLTIPNLDKWLIIVLVVFYLIGVVSSLIYLSLNHISNNIKL